MPLRALKEQPLDMRAESLEAKIYAECVKLSFPQLVSKLVEVLGKKLTAYIGGASNTTTVDGWIAGATAYKEGDRRLQAAFQVTRLIQSRGFAAEVVRSWFMGMNPDLGDRSAATVLREGEIEKAGREVLNAARGFIAGG